MNTKEDLEKLNKDELIGLIIYHQVMSYREFQLLLEEVLRDIEATLTNEGDLQ